MSADALATTPYDGAAEIANSVDVPKADSTALPLAGVQEQTDHKAALADFAASAVGSRNLAEDIAAAVECSRGRLKSMRENFAPVLNSAYPVYLHFTGPAREVAWETARKHCGLAGGRMRRPRRGSEANFVAPANIPTCGAPFSN